jgi:hypothetical protein
MADGMVSSWYVGSTARLSQQSVGTGGAMLHTSSSFLCYPVPVSMALAIEAKELSPLHHPVLLCIIKDVELRSNEAFIMLLTRRLGGSSSYRLLRGMLVWWRRAAYDVVYLAS